MTPITPPPGLLDKVAERIFETEFGAYSETACDDHNRWTWRGDGHPEKFKDYYREKARAAWDAVVEGLGLREALIFRRPPPPRERPTGAPAVIPPNLGPIGALVAAAAYSGASPERSILPSRVDAAAGAARVARYAEAIHGQPAARILTTDGVVTDEVRAVMTVADEEQAGLRAEIERAALDRDGAIRRAAAEIRLRDASEVERGRALRQLDALVADMRAIHVRVEQDGPEEDEDGRPLPPTVRYTCETCCDGEADLVTWPCATVAVLDKHAGEQAQGGEGS